MTQELVVVNASTILADAEVMAVIAPLQVQILRDFLPAWAGKVPPVVHVSFLPMTGIASIPATSWAIFLNKHSNDPGALGWHNDDANKVFARVFVGDCIRFGLNWRVTLSHEALEMILDPDIRRVYQMPNGHFAAFEACDAVEADRVGYDINGQRMSNFVMPDYFSSKRTGQYDFRGDLNAPCPALAEGGYMSVTDASGNWVQINSNRADGIPGRRALLHGHRREARARLSPDQFLAI